MNGKFRKPVIVFAIVALAVLNVWRWWPASSRTLTDEAEQASRGFNVVDFEVKATPADSLPPLLRDIFHPKKAIVVKHRTDQAPPKVEIAQENTPAVTEKESAQAEFSQIQCVGISVRNERAQAYLITAGEPSLVSAGDRVGSRFFVEKILPDGVSLRDPETDVGGIVTVSGKK